MRFFSLVFPFLIVALLPQLVRAIDVNLTAVADTTVKYATPSDSFGSQGTLDVLYDGGTNFTTAPVEVQESFIKFDLTSLPAGKVITSAHLKLKATGTSTYGYADARIRRVTQGWDETISWNTKPTYASESEANLEVTNNAFPDSVDLTTLVQKWYSGQAPNFGLALRVLGDIEYQQIYAGEDMHLSSREGTNAPLLSVVYSDSPPPSTPTPSPGGGSGGNGSSPGSSGGSTGTGGGSTSSSSPSASPGAGQAGGTSSSTSSSGDPQPLATKAPTFVQLKETSCIPEIDAIRLSLSLDKIEVRFTSNTPTIGQFYYAEASSVPEGANPAKAVNFAAKSILLEDTTPTRDHLFKLDVLSPATKYYYTLVSDAAQDCEHSFTTLSPSALGFVTNPSKGSGLAGGPEQLNGIKRLFLPLAEYLFQNQPEVEVLGIRFAGFSGTTLLMALIAIVLLFTFGRSTFERGFHFYRQMLNLPNSWFALTKSKKRGSTWGRVISSLTLKPIPRAMVALADSENGTLIDKTTSDENGFFGFPTQIGSYKLLASHGAYTFPSVLMPFGYEGGALKYESAFGLMQKDLPMDPQELTNPKIYVMETFCVSAELFRVPLLIAGTIVGLMSLLGGVSLGAIILLGYFAFLWRREVKARKTARYDLRLMSKDKKPLARALVQVKNSSGRVVVRKLASGGGRLLLVLPAARYTAEVVTFSGGNVVATDSQPLVFKPGIFIRHLTLETNLDSV